MSGTASRNPGLSYRWVGREHPIHRWVNDGEWLDSGQRTNLQAVKNLASKNTNLRHNTNFTNTGSNDQRNQRHRPSTTPVKCKCPQQTRCGHTRSSFEGSETSPAWQKLLRAEWSSQRIEHRKTCMQPNRVRLTSTVTCDNNKNLRSGERKRVFVVARSTQKSWNHSKSHHWVSYGNLSNGAGLAFFFLERFAGGLRVLWLVCWGLSGGLVYRKVRFRLKMFVC